MKYISFSFDDSRLDTYTVAYQIMKKYNIKGTVNVISDFVLNPHKYDMFASAKNPMTKEQLLVWQVEGNEIACHGSTHINTREDVLENIRELREMGLCVDKIGFASPQSDLCENNFKSTGIEDLYNEGTLSYIRTGVQVRRNGIFYILLCVLERLFHSDWLYWLLNKKNVFCANNVKPLIQSVAIKSYTKPSQIMYLIDKIADEDNVILMFHSVLYESDCGYGTDYYYWDAGNFEQLCKELAKREDIIVLTTMEMIEKVRK